MDQIEATPGAPAAPSAPVAPANAPTQTGEPAAPAAPAETSAPADGQPPEPSAPKHDPQAAQRYAMMQERKARQEAEKRASELEAKLAEKPPVFDETTDPDGTKQIEYLAGKKAEEMLKQKLSELGIENKLDEIERARLQDEFFGHVTEAAKEFSHLGIEISKDEVKAALDRFETNGITAQELVVLAKLGDIVKATRPSMPAPGEGAKAPLPSDAPKTNEQVMNGILARF